MKCTTAGKLSRHVINYQFIKSIDYRLLNSLRAEAAIYGGFYCNNIQFDSAVKVYNKNDYFMFQWSFYGKCKDLKWIFWMIS